MEIIINTLHKVVDQMTKNGERSSPWTNNVRTSVDVLLRKKNRHLGCGEQAAQVYVLGIPFSSVALFAVIQCALQIAVTPWLFAARATADNPAGRPLRRATVVIVWVTLASVAAFVQMLHGNFTDKSAAVFLGTPIVLGLISLFLLHKFYRQD